MKVIKIALAAAIAFIVIYIGFDYASDSKLSLAFNAAPGEAGSIVTVVLSLAAMCIGIVFGALYDRLLTAADEVSVALELRTLLASPRLVRALLVSPIVYAGVYAVSRTQPDLVISLVFAFENGFFCETIFREKHAHA